jgi:hypothetical protein
MTCGGRGTELPFGARFCLPCGLPQRAACARCGSALPDGTRFCSECGTPTPTGADGAPSSEAKADPSAARVVPPAVPGTERVAERRLCSLLFADLVGFTLRSEARDAEEVRDLLSRYFEVAAAGALFDRAIAALRRIPAPYHLAHALLDHADHLIALGEHAAAQGAMAEAAEIAERLHAAPLGERATEANERLKRAAYRSHLGGRLWLKAG